MAATDDYAAWQTPPPGPCRHAAAVAPNDGADLGNVTRRLYVGGTGDLVVVTAAGETATCRAVPAGTVLDIAVARVKATGTTATLIVALW